MEILSTLLTIVYVTCCLFLGFVVLIQKGEGGGLGGAFGGGAVDVAFGAKADMTWKRATAAAATLFMVLAVVLGILDQKMHSKSLAETSAPTAPADGDSEKPADGDSEKPADGEQPADGDAEKPADGGSDGEKPADGDGGSDGDGEKPADK